MAAGEVILAVNCGSSSVKLAVFDRRMNRLATATASGIHSGQGVDIALEGFGEPQREMLRHESDHAATIALLVDRVRHRFGDRISGIGHRVVHGGRHFTHPVLIDADAFDVIKALTALAPAHQPHNIEGIRAFGASLPDVPQVACFDTGFHRSIPLERQVYALPMHYAEDGLLAYGFHGLSCEHVVEALPQLTGRDLPARLVVCHLGNGASVTAVADGRSAANSMGFTPLDGLVMGSRSGRIDPGAVLWLVEKLGDTASVRDLLNRHSGLMGLSGRTSDMRTLLADGSEPARRAIAVFTDRLVREIASAAGALGGLDAIVFTGGIGERAAPIRKAAMDALSWLGLEPDDAANAANATTISSPGSGVAVHVVPADEERVIASAVAAYLPD